MKIYIAPMAGVTDYSFRQILKKYDPDLMYCEMLNSNLFLNNNKNTSKLLRMSEDENTGVQLFGGDIQVLEDGFLKLKQLGYKNLLLNMGCPQPKILKSESGAYLSNNPDKIRRLLHNLNSKNCRISLKLRLNENINEFIKIANDYEIDDLIIHLRTLEQKFDYNPNIDFLNSIPSNRKFNLIANGGIFSLDNFKKYQNTNIDGIMLARGVINRPWLIQEIKENRVIKYSKEDIKSLILNQLNLMIEDKGETTACLEINKFIKGYFEDRTDILKENDYLKKIKLIEEI